MEEMDYRERFLKPLRGFQDFLKSSGKFTDENNTKATKAENSLNDLLHFLEFGDYKPEDAIVVSNSIKKYRLERREALDLYDLHLRISEWVANNNNFMKSLELLINNIAHDVKLKEKRFYIERTTVVRDEVGKSFLPSPNETQNIETNIVTDLNTYNKSTSDLNKDLINSVIKTEEEEEDPVIEQETPSISCKYYQLPFKRLMVTEVEAIKKQYPVIKIDYTSNFPKVGDPESIYKSKSNRYYIYADCTGSAVAIAKSLLLKLAENKEKSESQTDIAAKEEVDNLIFQNLGLIHYRKVNLSTMTKKRRRTFDSQYPKKEKLNGSSFPDIGDPKTQYVCYDDNNTYVYEPK